MNFVGRYRIFEQFEDFEHQKMGAYGPLNHHDFSF